MPSDDEECAIKSLYAAATGQCGWEIAFDRVLAATGFDGAAFYAFDRATRIPFAERWHRLDPAYADTYLRDYLPIDPRGAQVFVPDPCRILYDYLHTAEADIDRDPFYAWFQPTQGMRYYVGGQSRVGSDLPLTLTLHRPRSRGHAGEAELQIFGRLFDHFEHAVTLQHGLSLDAGRVMNTLARQESETNGLVLFDRHLAVMHANAAVSRIAARGDAIVLSATGLSAQRAADDDALQRLIAAAARHVVTKPLPLARRFGGLPYVLTAFPISAADLLVGGDVAAVAVRIHDPDAADTTGITRAAAMLHLSAQETRILVRLVEGADPTEIAAEFGLKPMTVRTYLAAIYRKTGCHRQGALIARIGALARFLEDG